ncbi:MAG: hypothetical protein ABSC48_17395 [Terracidiphilus sp.]|jgi:hypothetical protein
MSIRFSIEVSDPHTENLLRYLEDALGDNYVHKLEVLSCAQQWLELEDKTPTVFNRGDSQKSLSLLLVPDHEGLGS